jgi:hypothetical protein
MSSWQCSKWSKHVGDEQGMRSVLKVVFALTINTDIMYDTSAIPALLYLSEISTLQNETNPESQQRKTRAV